MFVTDRRLSPVSARTDGVRQARSRGGSPPNFVVPRKFGFKHVIKTKILPPLKIHFAPPQTLKPGYWPGARAP